jgi:regulator of replication initiation timing
MNYQPGDRLLVEAEALDGGGFLLDGQIIAVHGTVAELEQLRAELESVVNDAGRFWRQWLERGQELDALRIERDNLRAALAHQAHHHTQPGGKRMTTTNPTKTLVLHVTVPGFHADDLNNRAKELADGCPTAEDRLEVVLEEWMREEVGITLVSLPNEKNMNDDFEIHAYTGRIVGAELRSREPRDNV